MAKCKTGQVYDVKIKKCRPYTKLEKKEIRSETLKGAVAGGWTGAGVGGAKGAVAGAAVTGHMTRKGAKRNIKERARTGKPYASKQLYATPTSKKKKKK